MERLKINSTLTNHPSKMRYNIYYTQYNIMARAYIPYIKVIYTDDIYHEIGKMICTSIEHIKKIGYTQPSASVESCENYWKKLGFIKISDTLWRLESKPKSDEYEDD